MAGNTQANDNPPTPWAQAPPRLPPPSPLPEPPPRGPVATVSGGGSWRPNLRSRPLQALLYAVFFSRSTGLPLQGVGVHGPRGDEGSAGFGARVRMVGLPSAQCTSGRVYNMNNIMLGAGKESGESTASSSLSGLVNVVDKQETEFDQKHVWHHQWQNPPPCPTKSKPTQNNLLEPCFAFPYGRSRIGYLRPVYVPHLAVISSGDADSCLQNHLCSC